MRPRRYFFFLSEEAIRLTEFWVFDKASANLREVLFIGSDIDNSFGAASHLKLLWGSSL
jgi:hypothetical protein